MEKAQGRPVCTAEVIDVRDLTYDVKEICLQLIDPTELHFTAGQYITIEVTEYKDEKPRLNNRPYSIASAPEERGILRLCVNRVGAGPGSTYLHSLKKNDRMTFSPPIGYFTVNEKETTSLLFVATGTGIAPIKSMIHHILAATPAPKSQRPLDTACTAWGLPQEQPLQAVQRPITLYWGLRSEADIYYQEAFSEWARDNPSFTFTTTLSRPSPAWPGMRGRVTAHLPDIMIPDVNNLDAYLCGNFEMIKEVRAILMARGVPKKKIHFEKFY